jgi:hypothetical protein
MFRNFPLLSCGNHAQVRQRQVHSWQLANCVTVRRPGSHYSRLMRFTISNQTHDSILCQFGTGNEHILLVPPFSESVQFSPKCTSLWFSGCSHWDDSSKELAAVADTASPVAIKLTMAPGRTWQRVTMQGDSPWAIYRNWVCSIMHGNHPGLR